ncbi:MAG: hypothetical protein M0R22_07635 [Dehalococcoidia bacterium]|jgi:hypothetical protein|nr:hypothetical protein [Dehalococcoidia bacterium]
MTDLVVQERTLPTLVPAQQWAERRRDFNVFVNSQLREGIDYGRVPGTDKDTLFKPGAEKIAQAYGCAPMLDITVRDQDPETGYLYIEVAVRLVSITTGAVVAVGVGSASSYESKYRYRYEWWNARGDPPGDGGWERTRNGKWRRRTLNPDLIDVWNTVLKVAKKRGLVDAALTVSGASEKFTQDVEDMPDPAPVEPEQRPVPTAPVSPGPVHVEPKPIPDDLKELWRARKDLFTAEYEAASLTRNEALRLLGKAVGRKLTGFTESGLTPDFAMAAIREQRDGEIETESVGMDRIV